MSFYISFARNLTFKHAENLREALQTYLHAAELLKIDIEILKEALRKNAALLFG
jgi:Tat protein secretion system quality control protein TatD with DNase activity